MPTADSPKLSTSLVTDRVGKRSCGSSGPAWYNPDHKPGNPFPAKPAWPKSFVNDKFWEKTRDERLRISAWNWGKIGYGVPVLIGSIYVVKMAIFAWIFYSYILPTVAAATTADPFRIEVVGKLCCFGILIEGLGLSASWGPLGGKNDKWTTAYWHFLVPGTIKSPSLPFFNPKANPLGDMGLISSTRSVLDCALYALMMGAAAWLTFAPLPDSIAALTAIVSGESVATKAEWNPFYLLVPMILFGFLDRAVYVCVRADYYVPFLMIFSFCGKDHWLAGVQIVQICVWLGAALSKCGPWFAYVTGVMVSNGFFVRNQMLRDALFDWNRDALAFKNPDRKLAGGQNNTKTPSLDFIPPSNFCYHMTYFGVCNEVMFPTMCLFGGPLVKSIGLFVSLCFHSYIIAMVPLGVPTEWNVVVVTVAYFAYKPGTPDVIPGVAQLVKQHPYIGWALLIQCVLIPILGNLVPRWVGFLNGYRYYAGNWASQVYLCKASAQRKFFIQQERKKFGVKTTEKDLPGITMCTRSLPQESTVDQFKMPDACSQFYKLAAFRSMYWSGRAMPQLLDLALSLVTAKKDAMELTAVFDDYLWLDGEQVAIIILGHGFGDGYLHDEKLLAEIQKRCGFEQGELLMISADAASILAPGDMPFGIFDAATLKSKGAEFKGMFDLNRGSVKMMKKK